MIGCLIQSRASFAHAAAIRALLVFTAAFFHAGRQGRCRQNPINGAVTIKGVFVKALAKRAVLLVVGGFVLHVASLSAQTVDPDTSNLPVLKPMPMYYSATSKNKLPDDVNGDGISDLFWMNDKTHQFAYWLMGARKQWSVTSPGAAYDTFGRIGWKVFDVTPGYKVGAIADFTGNGLADLVWTSPSHDLYLWEKNASDGGYTSKYIGFYPAGWKLIGAGDIDGDGLADLLWYNQGTCQFGYWIMNHEKIVRTRAMNADCRYRIVGVSDINKNGRLDIIWTAIIDGYNDFYIWYGNGEGFSSAHAGTYNYGTGEVTAVGRFNKLQNYKTVPGGVATFDRFDFIMGASIVSWSETDASATQPGWTGYFMDSGLANVAIDGRVSKGVVAYFGNYRTLQDSNAPYVVNPVFVGDPGVGMTSTSPANLCAGAANIYMSSMTCSPAINDIAQYSEGEIIPAGANLDVQYSSDWKMIGQLP